MPITSFYKLTLQCTKKYNWVWEEYPNQHFKVDAVLKSFFNVFASLQKQKYFPENWDFFADLNSSEFDYN